MKNKDYDRSGNAFTTTRTTPPRGTGHMQAALRTCVVISVGPGFPVRTIADNDDTLDRRRRRPTFGKQRACTTAVTMKNTARRVTGTRRPPPRVPPTVGQQRVSVDFFLFHNFLLFPPRPELWWSPYECFTTSIINNQQRGEVFRISPTPSPLPPPRGISQPQIVHNSLMMLMCTRITGTTD